jgi:type II secretory ATPase GspE/PulE/Tfp pilus assembly ATPase PilB-like protein/FixJ family two-component response regulator
MIKSDIQPRTTAIQPEHVADEVSPDSALGEKEAPEKHTILIVDDERSVLSALKRCLRGDGYEILTAENGQEGLDVMAGHRVSLIISDYRMPGLTGTEFLSMVRERAPQTIRILLTGATDTDAVMAAIEQGILYKYITKPWDDNDIAVTVRLALKQWDLIRANSSLRQHSGQQRREIHQLRSYLSSHGSPLGSDLVAAGIILPAQLEMIHRYCSQNNTVLFRAIVELGMVAEQVLLKVIQDRSNVDIIALEPSTLNKELAKLLPVETCESGCLVPLEQDGGTLILAMADVLDLQRLDYVSFVTGLTVRSRLASWSDIRKAIEAVYGPDEVDSHAISVSCELQDAADSDIAVVLDECENSDEEFSRVDTQSAVTLVNRIFSQAVRLGASDIHIEPKDEHTLIRYRVDGLLQDGMTVASRLHPSTISRLKILANMDISIRRIPQDGRILIKSGDRHVDVRISTLPTINGEKAVCRLLDKNASVKHMAETGIQGESLRRLERIISVPQGIIISTGPTGSGKTTTLYSLLHERMSNSLNFVTIEDPVEYWLGQASQVHIHEKIGLTFASTLRCTLRQDPDVILVGEIRDLETAQAAFQAAMTGHLVFTSLHTNSSIGAVTRLIHLGVQPYLVASCVQGIIAQRLVRKICANCSEMAEYDHNVIEILGFPLSDFPDRLKRGKGCAACNGTGFHGRLGLFEVFHMNDRFRQEMTSTYDETRLVNMAASMGMTTLLEDARQKVIDGATTVEEILRVLGPAMKFDLTCTECGGRLDPEFLACPFCCKEIRKICHACNRQLDVGWIACPYCGLRTKSGRESIVSDTLLK